jgi:transcriptional regulator with XRE-family HTH domain
MQGSKLLNSALRKFGVTHRSIMGGRKPTKEPGPIGARLRLLRAAISENNASKFAARIGVSSSRWANYEGDHPVPLAIAQKIIEAVPGLTLDWIYLGKPDGLPLALARRLEEASGEVRKGRTA